MTFREGIMQAAKHEGGIKMQPCLAMDPAWFSSIQEEVRNLQAARPPSDPGDKSHPTNWTKPYGNVTQHSLFNDSGNTADTATDHNLKIEGKSFVVPECAALNRLFSIFTNRALNFRLNGMLPKAGLSPHEENIIHGEKVRVRFHLPIFTNEQAKVMLDGEKFHLRPGYIYFFNNGSVHSAENGGQESRYHLVWDVFLDDWIDENICNLGSAQTPDPGLRKLTRAEAAALSVSEPWDIDEYVAYTGQVVKTGVAEFSRQAAKAQS